MRALRVQRQVERAHGNAQGLGVGLDHFGIPVLLVQGDGRVRELNSAAEQMLGRPDAPLIIESGVLTATHGRDGAALRREISGPAGGLAAAGAGSVLLLRGRGGGAGGAVLAAPVGRGDRIGLVAEPLVLVFVGVPGAERRADLAILASEFRLTPAEASVPAALLAGRSLSMIARERRVSPETVRHQVRTVLGKTGVHSQGQLVGLLSSSLAMLRRRGK